MCKFRDENCHPECVCFKCEYDDECDGTGGDGCENGSYMSGCGSAEDSESE